jgi:hypothetical protein
VTKALVTLISNQEQKTFPSVAAALAYLRPIVSVGKPGARIMYGSRRAFDMLRQKLKKATFDAIARDHEITNRWMSQASSWSDYYDFKDMREDAFRRHDISVGWLAYGGPELPVDSRSDGT